MVQTTALTPEDWDRCRRIRLAALADTPDAFWAMFADEQVQPAAFWRRRLADPDRLTVVAIRDGEDVGIMGAGPHHVHPDDAGLYSVWVAPQARGSGAAKAMLDHVVAWARDRDYRRLRLDVGDDNHRAIAFYRRMGFTQTGTTSHFPAPRAHLTEHELALGL